MRSWVRSSVGYGVVVGTALGFGFGFGACANGTQESPEADSGAPVVVGTDSGQGRDATPTVTLDSSVGSLEDSSLGAGDALDDAPLGAESDAAPDDANDASVIDNDSASDDSGTGTDASGIDSGADAASDDGGSDDAPGFDAFGFDAGEQDGGFTFTDPLQIDVSSIFTIDTIGSSAAGGAALLTATIPGALTAMDGSGYDFYTSTLGTANSVAGGLPPTGLIPASGTQNPAVQLSFSDTSTAANSVLLNGKAPNNAETLTFPVPPFSYTNLQIYGTSTEGASTLAVKLTYSDTSTSTTSVTIPDWGSSAGVTAPAFVLVGSLGRLGSGTFEGNTSFALYGVNLSPTVAKSVASVTLTHSGSGRFVFYGATAW
jgi:hypothetical protein